MIGKKPQKEFKYPGIRMAMDGNTAVIMCEREASDAAGAYPITPSTQMGEYWAEETAKGHVNVAGRPLIFVEPESVRVEGLYVFRGSASPLPAVSLLFPYPDHELVGGAQTLRLEARPPGGSWRPLDFQEMPQVPAARWRVPLDFGDHLEVRTVYRQELLARHARYIVTTARAWGVPLQQARFEIRLPETVIPTRFSLPFERWDADGDVFRLYEATPFAPDRDVVVEWEPSEGER